MADTENCLDRSSTVTSGRTRSKSRTDEIIQVSGRKGLREPRPPGTTLISVKMESVSPLPSLAAAAELTDEVIIERVRNGDTAIYEIIVRRHNQRLYRTIRAILRSDRDVEDVM